QSLIQGARSSEQISQLNFLIAATRGHCHYVVAEGIECAADLDTSRSAGVHAVQGYFMSKPSLLPEWSSVPTYVEDCFQKAAEKTAAMVSSANQEVTAIRH